MKLPTIFLILFLALVAIVLGYNYFFQPFSYLKNRPASVADQIATPSSQISSESKLLKAMSTSEKLAQVIAVPVTVTASTSGMSKLELAAGFYTLFGDRISTTSAQKTISELKKQSSGLLAPLIIVDHEGGTVQRLNGIGFTVLPSWQDMCHLPASDSGRLLSRSARELKAVGIDIVLAPVLDRAQSQPVLKNRICSNQVELIVERALAYQQIFKTVHILSVFKHFPGIGQTTKDLHQNFDRVLVATNDAQIYKTILDQDNEVGVMMSHVGVTNQYPDLPCSLSADCVGQVAVNYPQVLIFSDALEMKAAGFQAQIKEMKSLSQRSREAILAGNQVLIFGPSADQRELKVVIDDLTKYYDQGGIFKNKIDLAVTKVLETKKRLK